VEIEARVLNKDIGFVREGQSATVKIEAFPFTQYGALAAEEAVSGSDDAVQDERLGLVYSARTRRPKADMDVDGKRVRLSPGMAAHVEVKPGQTRD
jgi:hemolysin D